MRESIFPYKFLKKNYREKFDKNFKVFLAKKETVATLKGSRTGGGAGVKMGEKIVEKN
jgi:hypothetical protein